MVKLKNIVTEIKDFTKAEIGQIEPHCVSCNYDGNTIFSIFAEQGNIYEVIYDQIKANNQASEKSLL